MRGAGADVWGTTDALHLAWQPLDGDGSIVAHVGEVDGAHPWMKAGVMMRASLDPGSAHAFMLVSAGNGLAFQRRTAGGGQTGHTAAPSASMRWVKLVRHGTTITAAASHDGISWTTVGSDVFALGQRLHVGLAVTSHDATRLATATFDQVTVSPGS